MSAPAEIKPVYRPVVCRSTSLLPLTLLAAAVRMVGDSAGVDEIVQCCLPHIGGTHHGLVCEIDATHAVWAVWGRDGTPRLRVLADCPVLSPGGVDGADRAATTDPHPAADEQQREG